MGNILYFIKSYLNKVDFKKNTDTQSNVEESQAKKKKQTNKTQTYVEPRKTKQRRDKRFHSVKFKNIKHLCSVMKSRVFVTWEWDTREPHGALARSLVS